MATRILPGECHVTCADEAIVTVVGSCIAACVRDPQLRIGGMNHFMLPREIHPAGNDWLAPAAGLANRYGSHAMDSLVEQLLRLGAVRERLELKVFGGGRLLRAGADVGARNIEFIHAYAQAAGLSLRAQDLGGVQPRKVIYFPATGRVRVRRLCEQSAMEITRAGRRG